MKKIILFLTVFIFNTSLIIGQIEFNFIYSGGSRPIPCNPFKDEPNSFMDKWKVSHGTPSCGDPWKNSNYTAGVLSGRYLETDNTENTEGLFIALNFLPFHTYDITIGVSHNSGTQVGIEVFAANGVAESSNTNCTEDATPDISDKQIIYTTDAVFVGKIGEIGSEEISSWSPNVKYTQLWIKSYQKTKYLNGSLFIHYIYIVDNGVNDSQPPSTPTNLRASSITKNSFRLSWNPSTDNLGVNYYKIFRDANNPKNTTSTYLDATGLQPCTNYLMEVYAIDFNENYSLPAFLNVATKSSIPETLALNSDLTDQIVYYAEATNSITLSTGFAFKAIDQNYLFSAKAVCGCPNLVPTMQKSPQQDRSSHKVEPIITHRIYQLEKPTGKEIILLYPNPTSGILNLSVSNIEGKKTVQVLDVNGRMLIQHSFDSYDTKIDVSTLNSGVYFVKVFTSGENLVIKKIIKE